MKRATILQIPSMLTGLILLITACSHHQAESDAYGNFETDEIIVSAQSQGELIDLEISEGSHVEKGRIVGHIDSTVAVIKREQLLAQFAVIDARIRNLEAQIKVQEEQRRNMVREVDRMEKLLEGNAGTLQQYEDITGKLKVLDTQTETISSQRAIIQSERSVLKTQLEEVENMLAKCRITSPVSGIILENYIDAGELVTPGKSLFKVADIRNMELKVYVSGSQLSSFALGDSVNVMIDGEDESMHTLRGTISWISSQVEFTPKIIQTKAERVNMVYAVKIMVKNDGKLKIGMPGEVVFKN
jgi:HlyD family secretion protein